MPYYEINEGVLYQGDVVVVLNQIKSKSIHCCITSPPYWGLRDYGLPPMIWDGAEAEGCSHEWQKHIKPAANGIIHDQGMTGETLSARSATRRPKVSAFCSRCGAWRGSFGLEPTPELYIKHTVEIFREVKRVLRDDGTVWLNLGDSYAQGLGMARGKSYKRHSPVKSGLWKGTRSEKRDIGNYGAALESPGLKPKDLVGIPWRVAFALQADGWWLRQDIIWHKPNPMPESVTDRCTKAHEYIFLLTKSAKYFYDAEAIKEPSTNQGGAAADFVRTTKDHIIPNQTAPQHRLNRKHTKQTGTRNKRSVWKIATKPYKEAHFATFPPKLIEPCVLAGCPEGGTVLDPFFGAGTTGIVACKHGRKFTGIELNPKYCKIAKERIKNTLKEY